jgi:threo-3-hydroxy-L-aspartate ammonia-lyase
VYGVEPLAGNDFQQSFRTASIVKIDVPRTIADGAQTQAAGDLTFAVCRALLKDVLTVDDAALVKTMRFFAERMKMVIEPTGGLAAAVALLGDSEGKIDIKGKRVGIIVSGGNVDPAYYAKLLRDGV